MSMTDLYSKLSWTDCDANSNSYIHIVYTYQGRKYRIVFSYGQDLSILTTNTGWLDDGFYNGINHIESFFLTEKSDLLWELIHQYGGPLGDFYDDVRIKQDASGILTMTMEQKIFNNENQIIKIFNILGEQRIFRLTT
jgi:hypothetical protein